MFQESNKNISSSKIYIIIAAVLIIAIGIGIYFYFKISKAKQSQTGLSQPPAESIEQPISTQPPATGDKTNQAQEEFCGSSSKAQCSANSDCQAGGCSGQICAGKSAESPISTCEWRDCYDSTKYNLKCQCVSSQCQWSK